MNSKDLVILTLREEFEEFFTSYSLPKFPEIYCAGSVFSNLLHAGLNSSYEGEEIEVLSTPYDIDFFVFNPVFFQKIVEKIKENKDQAENPGDGQYRPIGDYEYYLSDVAISFKNYDGFLFQFIDAEKLGYTSIQDAIEKFDYLHAAVYLDMENFQLGSLPGAWDAAKSKRLIFKRPPAEFTRIRYDKFIKRGFTPDSATEELFNANQRYVINGRMQVTQEHGNETTTWQAPVTGVREGEMNLFVAGGRNVQYPARQTVPLTPQVTVREVDLTARETIDG